MRIVTNQISHHRIRMPLPITKLPASNCANVLFELVYNAGVLGPVAGIMHPRRDLIDQQGLAAIGPGDKKLHPENADIVERHHDMLGNPAGIGGGLRRYRWRGGPVAYPHG